MAMCAGGMFALSSSTISSPIRLLDQARSELLVAAGNAPEDDISVQLEIARTMEQAQDPSDALHIYKTILHRHPIPARGS